MEREVALARLRPLEKRLRQQGVSALYLFGSTARNEARDDSDLDLMYDYDPATKFSLFDQVGVMQEISNALGTKIDLVSRYGVHPYLKARVEADAIKVF